VASDKKVKVKVPSKGGSGGLPRGGQEKSSPHCLQRNQISVHGGPPFITAKVSDAIKPHERATSDPIEYSDNYTLLNAKEQLKGIVNSPLPDYVKTVQERLSYYHTKMKGRYPAGAYDDFTVTPEGLNTFAVVFKEEEIDYIFTKLDEKGIETKDKTIAYVHEYIEEFDIDHHYEYLNEEKKRDRWIRWRAAHFTQIGMIEVDYDTPCDIHNLDPYRNMPERSYPYRTVGYQRHQENIAKARRKPSPPERHPRGVEASKIQRKVPGLHPPISTPPPKESKWADPRHAWLKFPIITDIVSLIFKRKVPPKVPTIDDLNEMLDQSQAQCPTDLYVFLLAAVQHDFMEDFEHENNLYEEECSVPIELYQDELKEAMHEWHPSTCGLETILKPIESYAHVNQFEALQSQDIYNNSKYGANPPTFDSNGWATSSKGRAPPTVNTQRQAAIGDVESMIIVAKYRAALATEGDTKDPDYPNVCEYCLDPKHKADTNCPGKQTKCTLCKAFHTPLACPLHQYCRIHKKFGHFEAFCNPSRVYTPVKYKRFHERLKDFNDKIIKDKTKPSKPIIYKIDEVTFSGAESSLHPEMKGIVDAKPHHVETRLRSSSIILIDNTVWRLHEDGQGRPHGQVQVPRRR
jgi:hypothetical protein